MAIKIKGFMHNDDKIVSADGDADGTLAEDVQDWIDGLDTAPDLVSHSCAKIGSKVFTLVIIKT
tara:strand:+ start:1093 stop:1284 length:192 start_codon:yes stop_codon:yes gene_type:complete